MRIYMHFDWIAIFDIACHLKSESCGLFSGKENEKFYGLTLKQKDTLILVRRLRREHPDGISLKILAEQLKLAPATVSELVDNLVKQNYLTRERSLKDRRAICIKLSNNTSKMCELSEDSFSKTFKELLSGLEEKEKSTFLKCLSKIHNKIDHI